MRTLLLTILLTISVPAHARLVYEDAQGFTMTTVGWMDHEVFRDWTGIKVKLKLPPGGYVVLDQRASVEVYLPCKGWVKDVGIVSAIGCDLTPDTVKDSKNFRTMVLTEEMGCEQYDGCVLLVVRVPKFFTSKECRPTEIRWVGGYAYVEE